MKNVWRQCCLNITVLHLQLKRCSLKGNFSQSPHEAYSSITFIDQYHLQEGSTVNSCLRALEGLKGTVWGLYDKEKVHSEGRKVKEDNRR